MTLGPDEPLPSGRAPVRPAAGEAPRDPEYVEATGAQRPAELAASTTVGPVHLTVAHLRRSVDWYRRVVGLEALDRVDGQVELGVGERRLLVLFEEPSAVPARRHTGLYHFALLLPGRADLASWLAHAARDRVRLTGLSDHFVSEAIYLDDPDGHGIEIYADRPRSVWEGKVAARMTTLPLDVESLLAELPDPVTSPFDLLPAATVMGHVHFKVAAIPPTVSFYRDILGFALMARLGGQAAFLSAGGYHHHIGANTWESAGASPPPAGTASLRRATVVLPDDDELDAVARRVEAAGVAAVRGESQLEVADPSGNRLLLIVG